MRSISFPGATSVCGVFFVQGRTCADNYPRSSWKKKTPHTGVDPGKLNERTHYINDPHQIFAVKITNNNEQNKIEMNFIALCPDPACTRGLNSTNTIFYVKVTQEMSKKNYTRPSKNEQSRNRSLIDKKSCMNTLNIEEVIRCNV